MGGSGLPSSWENTLRFLAKISHNYSVGQPKCKQEGKCEYNDQEIKGIE